MIHCNIVITEYKNRICTMAFKDNHLEDMHVDAAESLLDNIYLAKVKNIKKNINAAFVELFESQMAFLPLEDAEESFFIHSKDKKLREGDELPVQVIRDGIKTKDPAVTSKLSINGAYAVVTLDERKGGFQYSKKLSAIQKQKLQKVLASYILPKGYAVIIRTGAGNLTNFSVLKEEIDTLITRMDILLNAARTRTCYSCIYQKTPSYIEYLHHNSLLDYEEIVTDKEDIFKILQTYYKGEKKIRLYQDSFPLKNVYSIDSKMEELFSPKIYLKSGGTLFVEYTEAMTVIDVNTGKSIASKEKADFIFQINSEAVNVIARHLRLRNISGIIVVDFINMENKEHQEELVRHLKKELKKDPVPCHFADITALGLVEITRKKIRRPIYEVFK